MLDTLTIGELKKVEEISGLSVNQFNDPDAPKAGFMIGIAFVMKRREDPKVKVSDIENMKMDEINELLGVTGN